MELLLSVGVLVRIVNIMKRRIFVFSLAVLMILPLSGCTTPMFVRGPHPDLFVVATHSLLGVSGEPFENPTILETDAFGRTMFAYTGLTVVGGSGTPGVLAVLIAQRTTGGYSYFYSGINFILYQLRPGTISDLGYRHVLSEDFIMEVFSEEQIEQLKMENSWNEELNEDRFFRVRVSRHTKWNTLPRVPTEVIRETLVAQLPDVHIPPRPHYAPLTMDKNGNLIYFAQVRHYPGFLFMFDADGNLTGVMELTDLWDYRDELREFKEAHGWSFYYR